MNLYWDYLPHSSEAEGLQYRDWWVAGAEDRLHDLASWMKQSGGPVASMDGTVSSLYELREWAAPYFAAGMPGVPPVEAFPDYRAWRDSWPRQWALHGAVDEYVLRVLRSLDPAIAWGMHGGKGRRIPDDTFHTTLYVGTGDRSGEPFARLFLHQWRPGERPVFDEPRIRELIDEQVARWGDPSTPQHRGSSLLVPYLTTEPRAFAERPAPPDFVRAHAVPEKLARQVIVSPDATSLVMESLPALSPARVAHALNFTGFRAAGQVRAEHLVDGARFFHNEGGSVATLVVRAGAVRGFLLEQPLIADLFERVGLETWPAPSAWADLGLCPAVTPQTPSMPHVDFPRAKQLTIASPRRPGPTVPSARSANQLDLDAAKTFARREGLAFPPRRSEKGDGSITPRRGDGTLRTTVTAHRIDFDVAQLPAARFGWLYAQAAQWADERAARLYVDGRLMTGARPAPLAHIPLTPETTPDNYGLAIHIVAESAHELEPATLPPLDRNIAAALAAFGFRSGRRPVRPKDLVDAARFTATISETVPRRHISGTTAELSAVVGAADHTARVLTLRHEYGVHWMLKHSPEAMPRLAALLERSGAKLAVGPALPSSTKELAELSSWAQLMGPKPQMPPGEYVISYGAPWRDPADLEPLPAPELLATLRRIGAALPNGDPVPDVFPDLLELEVLDGIVELYVSSSDGLPRLLQTDTHGGTLADWRPVQRALATFAERAGASFESVEEAWEDTPDE